MVLLLQTRLAESKLIDPTQELPDLLDPNNRSTERDWSVANKVTIHSSIEWTIGSLKSYKSGGPDRAIPAVLQQSKQVLVPTLYELIRASLATRYRRE